ncbi:MAG: hypothetical protein II661_03390, partial [Bacteroidales bacterium]|nr:hypothetical protein [Bacteroidales bacterium]
YYSGKPQVFLSMPGSTKYPLIYSAERPETTVTDIISEDTFYLYSNTPVLVEYTTNKHAVISLPTTKTSTLYTQAILPRFSKAGYTGEEAVDIPTRNNTTHVTGALLPWEEPNSSFYPEYAVSQNTIPFATNDARTDTLWFKDADGGDNSILHSEYLFIGEIYSDFTGADTRYGGISQSAVKNNRFVVAGPQYNLKNMRGASVIFGNQGDTYFQRWDCLRTKPFSNGYENNVIDITSVMLETHINLDGRSDLQRGIPELATIDTTAFGQLNRVYSQQNNYSVRRDLDEDFNTDSYRSSLTWTLEKHDMDTVDEWSHITLSSTLKLDADKGFCRALRRFQNSVVAFQDKAISEVLFNTRTQLSTTDGVPVELANSGKVDGKRYITNKYGCLNKWSIAEGKAGLYFVDNLNKAFCSLGAGGNGMGVTNISSNLGFGVWFRKKNSLQAWTPKRFDNFISFYDKVHSDVYLVSASVDEFFYDDEDTEKTPALVYNESLGAFTSFFDYGSVPMIVNVQDRLVSFRNHKLWLQNEGDYGNFYGTDYPYWVQYRVTPEPYSDKIWTNVEYRADFYTVLDENDNATHDVEYRFADDTNAYLPNETFDSMRFWNEYQTTPETFNPVPDKKFRIWRMVIPRSVKNEKNPHGLDRIRNPWLNLIFKKKASEDNRKTLMQLHDIVVKYFE